MATVGQQLLQPETGWKRFDDAYEKIVYSGNGTWYNYSGAQGVGHYNSTYHSTQVYGSSFPVVKTGYKTVIYTCTSNVRLIGYSNTFTCKSVNVLIDDVLIESFGTNVITGGEITQCLLYEKTGLEKKIHKIEFVTNDLNQMIIDAFDIDADGYLITEAEYSQGTKFPVLIGDDTITSETNIANYASTLVNGEKKLLVSSVLESIYVTDGAGGYTQVGWSMNKVNAELSTRDAKIQELEQAVNDIKASITKNTI